MKDEKKYKTFNVKLPLELWVFLKKESITREIPMVRLIEQCILKFKKSCYKKELTNNDADV